MATSKTLAPTNVTISIPAMADAPDASVFSNCVDKEADAINALNSQLVKDLGSKSLSDLETELVTLGNSLGTGGVAHFTVAVSTASSPFSSASYIGFIEKITTNRFAVTLSRNVVNQTICGRYNGSWTWNDYSLNGQAGSYSCVVIMGNFVTNYGCTGFVWIPGSDQFSTITINSATVYGISGDKKSDFSIGNKYKLGFILNCSADYSGKAVTLNFTTA